MKRIVRRIAWALFVVWCTVTIAFLVNHALPSDATRMNTGLPMGGTPSSLRAPGTRPNCTLPRIR